MRLILKTAFCVALALGFAAVYGKPVTAHPDQELLPEQSAAKARQVLQQVIAALGGPAFMSVRDTDCEGRVAQFGSTGR